MVLCFIENIFPTFCSRLKKIEIIPVAEHLAHAKKSISTYNPVCPDPTYFCDAVCCPDFTSCCPTGTSCVTDGCV
ncbi:hypothetical protein ACJMK2_024340 [Sinanodonta woodiana]|uniref:Granulins domain-containing protein n=1 Tax=Sinanodonta woodiana TaxID=1069815 RepID=A0ABD3T8H8_SINWO